MVEAFAALRIGLIALSYVVAQIGASDLGCCMRLETREIGFLSPPAGGLKPFLELRPFLGRRVLLLVGLRQLPTCNYATGRPRHGKRTGDTQLAE